ncbi:MAG: ATP-grasp domain-containing protein [Woeseiaceae bacterium]|nr:ATP-grasp domain-containing protein [Woeseiaceae bacterium]
MRTSTTKTVLLTLGRLPVALDLAHGFHNAGWRVIVADPLGMHLARMSKAVHRCVRVTAPATSPDAFASELLAVIDRFAIRLVVPVSEESPYVAALHDHLPDGVELFAPPLKNLLALHDKLRFSETAREFGLPAPRSTAGDDPERGSITEAGAYVVKPRHSCSGRHVEYYRAGTDCEAGANAVVQERLDGEHVSSFTIARDGRSLATSVYRGTVMSGSVAVCFERLDDAETVERWVDDFIARLGYTGFIAFDFIVDEEGVARAIECNPRATSGIHYIKSDSLPALIAGRRVDEPLREETALTESWSCYTAALGQLARPRHFLAAMAKLRAAHDVSWRHEDPWPFLLMMINTWPILWRAMRRGLSPPAAAMLDIEWRAEPGEC